MPKVFSNSQSKNTNIGSAEPTAQEVMKQFFNPQFKTNYIPNAEKKAGIHLKNTSMATKVGKLSSKYIELENTTYKGLEEVHILTKELSCSNSVIEAPDIYISKGLDTGNCRLIGTIHEIDNFDSF